MPANTSRIPGMSSRLPGRVRVRPGFLLLVVAAALSSLFCTGCSLFAGKVGKAMAGGNSVYAADDDPDFVWEAAPFGLKTVEALLERAPRSRDLLLAAASGFTSYGYGHLQQNADFVESNDLAQATALRARARKMYRRALEYGLRGLEVDDRDFRARLRKDPQHAVAGLRKKQVPLIYWTATAWGAAIAISKDDAELTADQNLVEALMRRALALDEGWERGSIHDFFIAYEGGRAAVGGSRERAREHFERARQLSRNERVAPLVSYAEVVSVSTQNQKEFRSLLEQALAFDADKVPAARMENLIAQRRAHWLLGRVAELFIE